MTADVLNLEQDLFAFRKYGRVDALRALIQRCAQVQLAHQGCQLAWRDG